MSRIFRIVFFIMSLHASFLVWKSFKFCACNFLRLLFQYTRKNAATITSVYVCQSKYKYKIMTFILSSELFRKGQVHLGGFYMERDISASRYDSAKRYIELLHFLVRYHLPVYMKQVIYRLTNKSFWKGDILVSRYVV